TLKTAVKMFKGEKAVIFAVWQAFLYPSLIRGFENMLMDYIVNPVAIKRLINLVTDYFSEQEKIALEIGADAIIDGEDYCSKSGPFMSIHHFEEFCLPGLQRVINIAKDRGAPFLKHCDGNIWPIIDIIINSGIDSLNPIEPAAGMDIGEVKKIYGKKITVHGNIDCAHLLTFGKPEDVRLAVKECIKKASPGGGHILSSSNIIHKGVPPENFMAMIKSGREFGEYPIKIE
ncbi:MAG: hypothetical protein M1365_04650, partial [Actinobacteria bacterium]|nr:hypothetical protein [Actinomycetota bacterium]